MAIEIVVPPIRFDTMTRLKLSNSNIWTLNPYRKRLQTPFMQCIDPQREPYRLVQFQTQALKDSKQVLPNICQRREQAGEGPREEKEAQAQ